MNFVSWVNSSLHINKLLFAWLIFLYGTCLCADFSGTTQFKAYTTESLKPGYKLYTDKQDRFSAAQPLGWDVNFPSPPSDGVIFSIQPSTDSNENVAVNVLVTPPATNIIEVAEATENYLINQSGVEKFELKNDQDISLSGAIGVERSVTFELNGIPLYVRTLYLQHSAYTFALSFTTGADNVDNMNSTFEHIIRNFTIM